MEKTKVLLLCGGKSGEHEISLISSISVFKALDPGKYDVTLVGIDKNGRWIQTSPQELLNTGLSPKTIKLKDPSESLSLITASKQNKSIVEVSGTNSATLTTKHFDVVVPILHGTFGEDGTMQGFLDVIGLPYVGSGVLGSAIGMDKDVAKRLADVAGVPVVPSFVVRKNEFESKSKQIFARAKKEFGFPYFIKPANMGSSVGVHKIKNAKEAEEKFKDAFQFDTKVLVEKAIDARELEVSILGNENPEASVVGEIVPNAEFYSYEAKYVDDKGADLHIPAKNLTKKEVGLIQKYAKTVFIALECRGMARVDFLFDRKKRKIYFNEVNTIPGFTSISMYPKLWEASGVPYSRLLDRLIELALEQFKEKQNLMTSISP